MSKRPYAASHAEVSASIAPPQGCTRCGRGSHSALSCYASTRVDGSFISSAAQPSMPSATQPASQTQPASLSQSQSQQPPAPARKAAPLAPPCSRCGRTTHTSSGCYASSRVDGHAITVSAQQSQSSAPQSQSQEPSTLSTVAPTPQSLEPPASSRAAAEAVPACTRCGRTTHAAASCYASSRADGSALSSAVLQPQSLSQLLKSPAPSQASAAPARGCRRCGRDSHSSSRCYAAKHLDGSLLEDPATQTLASLAEDESEGAGDASQDEAGEEDNESLNSLDCAAATLSCTRCGRDGHCGRWRWRWCGWGWGWGSCSEWPPRWRRRRLARCSVGAAGERRGGAVARHTGCLGAGALPRARGAAGGGARAPSLAG